MLHVIENEADGAALRAEHGRAIVSLCIGDRHRSLWERMGRSSWLAYAGRHGYDVILVAAPLDRSESARSRSPAWQKCLVLEQDWSASYERIVWLDADIVISAQARDIVATQPDPALVGLCPIGDQLSRAELHVYLERFHQIVIGPEQIDLLWAMHVGNQFERAGVPPGEATMFNTGVMVLSPAHHAAVLRAAYGFAGEECGLYEQPALSQAICRLGLHGALSARFNWSMHEAMLLRFATQLLPPLSRRQMQDVLAFVMDEMEKAFFVHFCGCQPLLAMLADISGPAMAALPARLAAAL